MDFKRKFYSTLKSIEKYADADILYFIKGGFWLTLGKAIVFLISLATMWFFANFASKEIYGGYKYLLSATTILSIFSLPGISTALVRAVAKGKEKMLIRCTKESLIFGFLVFLSCLAVSFWYFFHKNNVLGFSFLIAGFLLPLMSAFSISLSFWEGKNRFDKSSQYLIWLNLASTVFVILAIFFTKNLIWIILSYFLPRTIVSFFIFKLSRKSISNQEEDQETINYGRHLTIIQGLGIFSGEIDKIILWQFLGPIPLALYSFAQIPIIRIQELVPISSVALPKLSQKSLTEVKENVFSKFTKLFLFSIPFSLFYILASPFLFKILFPTYLDSVIYSQVLAIVLVLLPFSLLTTSLVAEMKKKELYTLQIIVPSVKIILFLILIPRFGAWGAIASLIFSQFFESIFTLYFFKKI